MEHDDESTTIRVSRKAKRMMDQIKIHHRETYEDIIVRLIKTTKKEKKGRMRV